MSCRVLHYGDGSVAAPIAWRQVGQVAAGVEQPGVTERLAAMEAQFRRQLEETRQAAYREGEAAGRSRAAAEVQPVVEKLARSVEELALLRPRLRREAELDMLRLALAVARRVLRRELAVDPDALHGLALAALEKIAGQEIQRVKVHSSMAAQIRALLEKSAARGMVEVVADGSAAPGTLVFETERGNLDASVQTQLEEIERGLTDRLRQRS